MKLIRLLFILSFTGIIYSTKAEFFQISSYNVHIELSDQGYFDVSEEILVEFESGRRGIFRTIPLYYTIDSNKVKLRISNILVENWEFKAYEENGNQVVRIGSPDILVDGQQLYKISYRVQRAFLWHGNQPEFYWDVVGTEWEVPIENISYEVVFPDSLEIKSEHTKVFTGPKNAKEISVGVQRKRNTFFGKSTRIFQPGEGLTMAVLLPEGFIDKQQFIRESSGKPLPRQTDFLPIPVVIALLLFGGWRKYGRNERNYSMTSTTIFPPENMSAAEAGLFIDNRVNSRDLIALIPEWGNLGYIRVSRGDLDAKNTAEHIYLEKLADLPLDAPEYQRVLFDELFKNGEIARLSDLQNKVYGAVAKSGKLLRRKVRMQDLYDLQAYRIFHSGWMILAFILLIGAGISIMVLYQQIISGILIILLGIAAFIIQFASPKKTEKGLVLHHKLKSFRQFLKEMPDDKINALVSEDPDYFNKVYPFVVAFGLDMSFSNGMTRHMEYAPFWYCYHNTHHRDQRPSFADFTSGFSTKTITSAFVSQPQSPGGGGGFSGGSAGGGFGGGGGGSW